MGSLANKLFTVVILVFLFSGCYDPSEYYYSANDIFKDLEIDFVDKNGVKVDSVLADGKSIIKVKCNFPLYVDTTLSKLTFHLSNGTFLESSSNTFATNFFSVDSTKTNRVVEATIISSTSIGNSVLTIKLSNNVALYTVKFFKAYPTNISLDANPFYLKNDSIKEIQILASLESENGYVSKGHKVNLSYEPTTVGLLKSSQVSTNSESVAEFIFVFTDTNFTGEVTFKAGTTKESQETIYSNASLKIIE